MKNDTRKKTILKKTAIVISLFIFCVSFYTVAFSATDTAFEKAITDFPESYKVYLRQLHEMYPDWEFRALKTGLDWNTVIDNEVGDKSLVDNSVSAADLKSKAVGDYDYSKGAYIEKDGGFVAANRLAVEYFMDPRNFLNEESVFQFEDLGFDSTITQANVEAVLKGTFMENAKMNYYDSSGSLVTATKTYSAAIYEAGKKYGINPCFLASKIKNEVGSSGSGSSSGLHSTYPGIYNFYNIGAYDGANAIAKGLKWASEGTTYGRPWTSPYKSILGGAQWIADNYVAIGQNTGYFQRFNVNPSCTKPLYTHQYMTNLTGALSQGYTTYLSYVKGNVLNRKIVFTIPVYENMPSESTDLQGKNNADSTVQTGIVYNSYGYSYVRTGPSTDYARLLDSSNTAIKLNQNHSLQILGKYTTDATYYVNILQYPHWLKVQFTYNSQTYTGYVPESFVSITSTTSVSTGTYDLSYIKGESESLNIVSSNPNIAVVVSPMQVNFVSSGTVELITYDSTGRYDKVKYVVDASSSTAVGSISVTKYTTSLKFTATKRTDALKYQFTLFDYTTGEIVSTVTTANNYYTFKNLTNSKRYTCAVRCVLSTDSAEKYGATKSLTGFTKPQTVTSLVGENTDNGVKVSWNPVENITAYLVYGFNESTGKYTKIAKTTDSSTVLSYDVLVYDSYAVRAYVKDSVGTEYSAYSEHIVISNLPTAPANIGVENLTSNGYTITWDAVNGVEGYDVYKYSSAENKYVLLSETVSNSIAVSSLSAGESAKYKICSHKTINSEKVYSEYSAEFEITTLPDKMTTVTAYDETDRSVSLKWSAVSGAAVYRVYLVEGDKKTLLSETEKLSVIIDELTSFKNYTFCVVPCVKNISIVYESTNSTTIDARTKITAVSDLSVKSKSVDYIKLKWSKNSVATKYQVYSYDSSSKKYTLIGNTTSTTYTVKNLAINKTYKFAVRVVGVASDNGKTYYSSYSSILTAKTAVPVPTGFGFTDVTSTSYKIKWTAVDGAVSYNIYRKTDGEYVKIANTKSNTYTVKGRKAGKKEYYKITTVMKVDSKSYESVLSDWFSVAALPSTVTSLQATPYVNSVKITWKAVSGASRYRVYIYDSTAGKYVKKADVTGTSCTLKSLTSGKTYKIAVRAFTDLRKGSVYSSMAKLTVTTLPSKVTSVSVSNVKTTSHTLNWSKASKANYYYIYRYSSSSKKYVKIAGTAKTTYTVNDLSSGKTYKYKIISAVLSNGKCLAKGSASSVYSFATLPEKVTSLKGTSTESSIKLTWKKVTGATKYEVYYYDADASAYFLAGSVDTNTFSIQNLASEKSYKFKVKAVRVVSGKSYKAASSSALTVKTK